MPKESFRGKIINLAEENSNWEAIARELITQMSEKDAEDFYEYFVENY